MDALRNKYVLLELSKNDFKSRYLGSYLGLIWAFIQPSIYMLIFWFVFQVGFKTMPVDNFPFILWLMTGMIPWFFFSDSLSNGANSIVENSFLVKKVIFKVSLLPFIKILSAFYIHAFFLVFLTVMFLYYGYVPNIYSLQIFYYLFALVMLLIGLTLLTSSLVVFLKDIGQIINMVLQFGFWLTPIFWSFNILPKEYHNIMQYNPLYYIVEGYRDSMISYQWFWEKPVLTIHYWVFTIIIFLIGTFVFKRLRPHFADVL